MEWHSIKEDGLPKEDGEYLVTLKYLNIPEVVDIIRFSNDLYGVDKYDFPGSRYKDKKGFYEYDSTWGYHEVELEDVIAWAEVEPYKGE